MRFYLAGYLQVDNQAHKLLKIKGDTWFLIRRKSSIANKDSGENFRFGSFNHARKLSDASIDLFCAVMSACPNAELVLKSISFHEKAEAERILQRFEKAGLEPDRLILLEWIEGGINHLQLYRHMDVALDPIPYGGCYHHS